jgi:arylsulfatase A-like enzyme/Flp pilus assembly protein TadD
MFPLRCSLFLLIAGLAVLLPIAAAQPAPAPNVLVITIDTLRPDHLGCYGYKHIHTPNIDALAADGFRFARAYTAVPVTLPSHTVIFTGTYPMYNGMHDFSGNKLGDQPTLASVLKAEGYTTGAVIGSAVLDSRFGLNRGFDFYYDHFDFNRLLESNVEEMKRPGNVVAGVALDWLSKNSKSKFFLWTHFYDAHFPYQPPEPYATEYKNAPYDGEIAFADEQIGRVIGFLKDKNLYQNTLIVLCADHGESLGEHGEKTHGFFIYNSTLHVPLIIHLPGAQPHGPRVLDNLASLADIMPTVLHILHIDVPSDVQGDNLSPLIEGKHEDQPRSLYAETFLPRLHFNWSELRSIETEQYQFIEAPKPELYDLAKDPGETNNLFAQKRAVSDVLRARLTNFIVQHSAEHELAEKTGLDPALMERLKSLGYAGFSGGGSPTASNLSLPDPKDRLQAYLLFSDAMADSQHGRYPESVEKLDSVLKVDPDSVPAHYILGLDYYRMHEYPLAVQNLQRVVQLSPSYSLATYYLGLAYAQNGDADNAIATLKRTLELDGTNFDAAYNLGAVYLRKGMIPEAVSAFRQAAAIAPNYPPAHKALGQVLLYQGQVDEAIAELRRAAELQPQDASIHVALAKALAAKGLNQQAQEEMRRAQQVQPQ